MRVSLLSKTMFKLKTRTLILLVTVGILETWLRHVVGFAHPKSEFLLDVDGNSVATAREHLCVIEKKQGNGIGGRARCFGADHIEGRTQAPQDIDFVQVVAGLFFSCGIAVDQTVHCWGSITRTVPGLYTQISTDSGSFFACGVLVDGTINCWGFYDYKLKPPSPPNVKFTQISCAEKHCCALDDKGYPYCWGERVPSHIEPPKITYKEFLQSKENAGWLIRPEPDEYEDDGEEAPKLSPHESEVSYVQFRQISVGESISCGVTLLGSHLLCWGDPVDFFVHKDLPRQHKGPYRQVSVGSAGVCAIRADIEDLANEEFAVEVPDGHLPDRLECWGPAKSIINQYKFDAWDQVSVGSNYVCGVSMDSEVECGGYIPGDEHKNIIIA